jgi:flagellar hook protein FlgE
MKKIVLSILIALPLMTFSISAENDVIKTGTILSINEDGTGFLKDNASGEIVYYVTRNGEFHRDANGNLRGPYLNIGQEVSYNSIQDEAKGFSSLIR